MVVAGFLTTCCCLIIHVICRGGVVTLAAFSSSNNSRRRCSYARARREANANADAVLENGQRRHGRHSRSFSTAGGVTTDYDYVQTTATPSSTATGVADRAFRSGISLEKAGRARSASAAFHEAAALYRRYLDGGGDSGTTFDDDHDITPPSSSSSSSNNNDGAANNNNPNDDDNAFDNANNNADNELVVSLLAYCYIRIGHLTNDAFGNAVDATKFYQLATTIDAVYPSAVSYHGIGTCIEASLDGTTTATATTTTTTTTSSGANDGDDDDGKRTVEVVQQQQQQQQQHQQQQQNNAEINNNNWKKQMKHAIESYRKANEILISNSNNNDEVVRFHLAVALERIGEVEESTQIMDYLRRDNRVVDDDDDNNNNNEENNNLVSYSYLVNSWGYVRWHTRRIPTHLLNLHRGTRAMLQIALHAALPLLLPLKDNNNNGGGGGGGGLVCEFGVASGRSIRMIKELLLMEEEEDIQIHGFDTFTGLPSAWGDEPAGSYSTGGAIPNMMEETTTTEGSSGSDERTSEGSSSSNVIFHQGLFRDTIPTFLSTIDKGRPLAYANIDCDLYSSTRDVLEAFHGRIVPGTVLVFDEYLCHPSWRQDEFRAWRECCKRFGWQYEYLAFSLSTKQVVVRVTS